MSGNSGIRLELDDIQAAVLYPRPSPYVGTLIFARVDDRRDGRELLRRLIPTLVTAAPTSQDPKREAWAAVALTFQGLKALGVPADNLATFPETFRQGMAARADLLGLRLLFRRREHQRAARAQKLDLARQMLQGARAEDDAPGKLIVGE